MKAVLIKIPSPSFIHILSPFRLTRRFTYIACTINDTRPLRGILHQTIHCKEWDREWGSVSHVCSDVDG
jgi:hypothetical protein